MNLRRETRGGHDRADTNTPANEPEEDGVPAVLLRLCRSLAGEPSSPGLPTTAPTVALWHAVLHHRLLGAVSAEALGASLPPDWTRCVQGQYLRSLRALEQAREIASTAAEAGIRVLPLKGAAALTWLYPELEQRALGDLDLLVRPEQAEAACRTLLDLGYAPLASSTSPEEEQVKARRTHFPPYVRTGSLPVELHLQVLGSRGRREAALRDLWGAATPDELDGIPVHRLAWRHFFLHGAVHYVRHLEEDFAPLAWLVDLALLARRHPETVAWNELRQCAERWGIERELGQVCRVLAAYLGVSGPDWPQQAPEWAWERLATGSARREARAWETCRDRLAAVGEIRGWAARGRYLIRQAFPSEAHLRWRYALAPTEPIGPWRAHFFRRRAHGVVGSFKAAMRRKREATGNGNE